MRKIWKKIGNPMPVERVMGANRTNMENYGHLLPIARNMKPTLWVPDVSLSFGLLSKGGLPLIAETTRRHVFSTEISEVILSVMVFVPNFYF